MTLHLHGIWPEPCDCKLDQDGLCGRCAKLTYEALCRVIGSLLDSHEYQLEVCKSCRQKYTDWAAAKAVREFLAKRIPDDPERVLDIALGFKLQCGVPVTPLLDMEIARLRGEKPKKEGQP